MHNAFKNPEICLGNVKKYNLYKTQTITWKAVIVKDSIVYQTKLYGSEFIIFWRANVCFYFLLYRNCNSKCFLLKYIIQKILQMCICNCIWWKNINSNTYLNNKN